jgi:hypothetical protein
MDTDEQRRNLVWALRDRLPIERITPTHVVESDHFPEPPLIDGHRPDLLAESFAGTMVIGIAKNGSELDSDLSAEQYRTFASYQDPKSGERAALVVAVRSEHKAQAEEAIEKAGLTSDHYSVFPVTFPTE